MLRPALLAAFLLATGCAGARTRPPGEPLTTRAFRPATPAAASPAYPPSPGSGEGHWAADPADAAFRSGLAQAASAQLGQPRPTGPARRYRADCSGFAQAIYEGAGIDLFGDGARSPRENGVAIMHRYVAARAGLHEGPPRPGDLAFFHDSYDRNRDGRLNDPLTHVAVVERVEEDGTVVMVHYARGRVRPLRMNLAHPTDRARNDPLRAVTPRRLTSELFAGYGTLPPPRPPVPEV